MSEDDMRHGEEWYRRGFMRATGAATVLGLQAGVVGAQENGQGDEVVTTDEQPQLPDAQQRIDLAERVGPRDFHEENYEILNVHRRKEAIQTLLRDPEVNRVAGDWIAHFISYEALTNHLDAISIQGPTDYTVDGSLETGTFDVTAVDRQTIYGLIDRRRNEIVALQIEEPTDVQWTEEYTEEEVRRGQIVLDQEEVQQYVEGKEFWPMFKVAESITSGRGLAHYEMSTIVLYVVDEDSVSVVSGFLDVREEGNPQFLKAYIVDDFIRYPVQQLARETATNDESALEQVPNVPVEKRPMKTANNGFHRFETLPEQQFQQDNWNVRWEPPETQGVTFWGEYNGSPVFSTMNAMATPTAYGLPPREGRNTREWYFPDDEPVINGHHIFWDVHSIPFGGPGQLAKIDYPARRGHPSGFQFRTHYHTGAQGRGSVDFHSGAQFGPYNYNISYEFFEDGRIVPIWRRHGPGYVVEALRNYGVPEDWEGEETVVQQYLHLTALEPTPGTTDGGVRTQVFDGEEWLTPESEFYLEGEPGQKVRFSNPDGSEQIDVPMSRDLEVVVVRPHSDEIGPAQDQVTRTDDREVEAEFYHPAQYVDGEGIQDQRVIFWLIMEASMDEVPHPAGTTGYVAQAEFQLNGYES
ncbi:hypothetical protein [Natrinema salsiterrestre]|uniref:Uncharacterized protein n=1 Tax=Natrinema salsiterrestre TaxID=2950540 RepID=A0A9Q4L4H4_9EURY|nr:hypothetical protein [Natrinema salsiterrestre]MDF9746698.1 hypothetical protein [Natrinema salsiterrestre]